VGRCQACSKNVHPLRLESMGELKISPMKTSSDRDLLIGFDYIKIKNIMS